MASTAPSDTTDVRLPTNVIPKLYKLELEALTDLDKFSFTGSVAIDLEVKAKGLKSMTCHAVDLKIESKDVAFVSGSTTVAVSSISFSEKLETVTFSFASPLPVGNGILNIKKYVGELNDKMKGFYRSKYQVEGKDKYMAVTQFEATDARRCLPCWDEPSVKAEFEATVTCPKSETAISNMPVVKGFPKKADHDDSLLVWKFAKTPRMSTYLLAFVVGQFDYIEANSAAAEFKDGKAVGDVAIRVYAPKGKTSQATFALDVACKCLNYFTEFFQIGYPLPKLDLIAIPDFSSGAMENWGCVTYRTICLLVDEKNTSLKNKQYVAIVVAHELAHQWFGNLVTMEWWTELWLNEGFASWVEYLAVDKLFPEWKVWQSFLNDAHNPALGLDGLLTSHPIEVPVKHPSEIDEIFDAISYLKGASVIRMLASHLGLETFRKGLISYLNEFKYRNATTIDLWRMLEIGGKLPEKSVSDLMTNWTGRMGYPVLSVEQVQGGIKVSQKHFVASGDKGQDTCWQVPIVYDLYDGNSLIATKKYLLKSESEVIPVDCKYTAAVFNKGSQAYFLVKYGPEMFKKLVSAIQSGALTDPVDRLTVQHNLMAIVQAGIDSSVSCKDYFNLVKAYKDETEFIVWESILANMGKISSLVKVAGFDSAYSKYMVELLEPLAAKLGWEAKKGEKATDQMLRAQVIPLIGIHGHKETMDKATSVFNQFFSQGQYKEDFKGTPSLPADFRSGVYRMMVKSTGSKAYDQLITMYETTSLQEEKVRILRSLGASKDKDLLDRTLSLSLDFEKVRKQDMMYPIFGAVGTNEGLVRTWSFLKSKWKFILDNFKGTHMLVRLASITNRFATEEDRKDVETFFSNNEHPGAERRVKQCLEGIGTNARWLKRDRDAIAKCLGEAS